MTWLGEHRARAVPLGARRSGIVASPPGRTVPRAWSTGDMEPTAAPWPRPVPLVGGARSPPGWAVGSQVREALHAVIGARRDVRRYRPDAVPADVLERVLTAAHQAPSVGHSPPRRVVVVRAERRAR